MVEVRKFRLKRGTKERWEGLNPILDSGEPGVEIDTGFFKIGDGHTAYIDLEYFLTESSVSGIVEVILAEIDPEVNSFYVPFERSGNLQVFTSPRFYFPDDVELLGATFAVTTAPTGSSAIFEVFKNGSGSFSSDPTISASGFLGSAGTLADITTFIARTDYLQIRCLQIGSIIPGADLAVMLKMRLI